MQIIYFLYHQRDLQRFFGGETVSLILSFFLLPNQSKKRIFDIRIRKECIESLTVTPSTFWSSDYNVFLFDHIRFKLNQQIPSRLDESKEGPHSCASVYTRKKLSKYSTLKGRSCTPGLSLQFFRATFHRPDFGRGFEETLRSFYTPVFFILFPHHVCLKR